MLRFPSKQVGRGAVATPTAGHCAMPISRVICLLVVCAFLWAAGESAGQPEAEPEAAVQPVPGSAAETVQETLARIDGLLSEFDTRIQGVRLRAEELLDQADGARDPDEQMRLEELYGRMMTTAQGLEEQRSKLREMREELVTFIDATAP